MGPPMTEIAAIAQDYFSQHAFHSMMLVDDQISVAIGQRQWGEVLKWQRVRCRIERLQAMHAGSAALRLS